MKESMYYIPDNRRHVGQKRHAPINVESKPDESESKNECPPKPLPDNNKATEPVTYTVEPTNPTEDMTESPPMRYMETPRYQGRATNRRACKALRKSQELPRR